MSNALIFRGTVKNLDMQNYSPTRSCYGSFSNRFARVTLLMLPLLLGSASAQISVNATGGIPGPSNYTTLKGAFDAINSGVHQAAVIITITGNTTETATATLNASGTSTASYSSVVIKPTGTTRTISGNIPSDALIRLNGADNVTLDGSLNGTTSRDLTIKNAATFAPTVISLLSESLGAGSTYATIKNCNLTTGVTTRTGYGILVTGSDNDNVILENNAITEAAFGITAYGTESLSSGGNDNLSIIGNSIEYKGNNSTSGARGILVRYALNSLISQNTISLETSGQGLPTAIALETGFVSSLVTRNIVLKSLSTQSVTPYVSGARGITVGTGTAESDLTISNNVIYGVGGPNFTDFGRATVGIAIGTLGSSFPSDVVTGGVNLFSNSIYMTGSLGTISSRGVSTAVYLGINVSGLDIRNNIFANTQVATNVGQKNYAIYSDVPSTAFTTINRNDYFVSNSFNPPSAIPGFLDSARLNLAEIQAGFGQNEKSLIGNPLFPSTTNLQITSFASPV
jgi:hypothetical protein